MFPCVMEVKSTVRPKFSHLHCDHFGECSLDFSFKRNFHIKISTRLQDTFLFMSDVRVITAGAHTFAPRTTNLNRKVFPFAYRKSRSPD